MSDPVRDTRQAVDAARENMMACLFTCRDEMQRTKENGPCGLCAWAVEEYEAAVEAWVLARERRETLARGGAAAEARP
jgi:hypothetical protein